MKARWGRRFFFMVTGSLLFLSNADQQIYQKIDQLQVRGVEYLQIKEVARSLALDTKNLRLNHAKELLGQYYNKSVVKEYGEKLANLRRYIHLRTHRVMKGEFKKYADEITNTVMEEAKKYEFDPMFLLAVIESESSFRPHVVGSAGEIGLMQIRPNTAKWIAEKIGLKWEGKHSLRNPKFNIQIGAAYLSMLRNRFNNHGSLYLAAYNMGSSNVRKNLDREIIPKKYANRVMEKYVRFYGELKTLFKKSST